MMYDREGRGYERDFAPPSRQRESEGGDTAKARRPAEAATERAYRLRLEVGAAATRADKLSTLPRHEEWRTEHANLAAMHTNLDTEVKARAADAKVSQRAQTHYTAATAELGEIATTLANAKEPSRPVPAVPGEEAIEPSIINRSAAPDDVVAWVAGLGRAERNALAARIQRVGGGAADRKDGFAVELANYLGNKQMRSEFLQVANDPRRFNRAAYEEAHARATAANAQTGADRSGTSTTTPTVTPPTVETPSRSVSPVSREQVTGGPSVQRKDPATDNVARHGDRTIDLAPPASLHLGPNAKQPGAHTKTGNKPSGGLGDWVGAGNAGKIFRNATAETFVDPATKQMVEIETSWMMAEFDQFELKTNMAMEVERKIHIQLARSGVVIKSRARAFLTADQLPNDVHAALHAPARLLTHDGAIFVTDDKGMHLLKSLDHLQLEEPSVAALLAHDPMLGYETAPQQRIREADQFVAVTVPTYDDNMLLVEGIMRDAPHAAMGLKNYLQAKLGYETPSLEALSIGRHMIARLEELLQFSWTGYEGTNLMFQLGQMWEGFTQLLHEAETAKPAEKHVLDHASDLVAAIGKAGVGVVLAVKEVGFMARDLGMKGLDKLANAFGYEIDWSAASSIGKAYESDKSTSQIFTAIVDGIIDSWTNAIDHAENGDYSKLMDLGAEFALDIAIEVATAGAATAGVAAKRAGTAAQLAEHALVLTEGAAGVLTRRTETLLQRAKQALKRAPEEARAALLDTIDTASGWFTGLKESVKVADAGVGTMRVVEKAAISRAIQRSRGVGAIETAKDAMKKLRGPAARAHGASVVERLEKLAKASKMPDTIYALARRIAEGEDKAKFVGALDKLLKGTAKALDEEVVAGVLRRAADAVDPFAFLVNVEWVMSRQGLTGEARKALVRRAVLSDGPLDLRWLRELTDLPDNMLEGMALDPSTNWKSFMKVSKKPSDYFPSSLKKALKNTDYADAAVKLRGVAGEMMFIVEGVELPAGLKIIARQVDAAGKTIDFALRDATGQLAKLEVKAWTAKRWATELGKKKSKMIERMIEQLKAAKSTGQRVYLAVSDAIGATEPELLLLLERKGLLDVTVVTFSETKLKIVGDRLRKGLGIAAGLVTVTTDQIGREQADDTDD